MRILVFVRLANNAPAPPGVTVRLEADEGGVVDEQTTDSSGKVTFIPKAQAAYTVIVRDRDYREVARHVDLTLVPTASVSLELVPIPGEHPPTGPGATVSVAEAAIPEQARSEFEKGKRLLDEKHDASSSIGHFKKAIKTYDNFPQAYTLLGMAYLQDKDLPDSKAALEKAIQLDPKSGAAYIALGGCLNQMKDYSAAENALKKGLDIAPEAPEGNYELAKTYWAMHRWKDAEPYALKAEKLQPDVPGVHVVIGNILLQKQDTAGALKEFKEYLRLDPHGAMSEPVQAMVGKLEKAAAASSK